MGAVIQYTFKAKVWVYEGKGGWYFVSLPQALSAEIRELLKFEEAGWGRLNAVAVSGSTEWKTAIWFDTKQNTYLLPLKAAVRKQEKIEPGNELTVKLFL